jgi:hypothetical protein
MRLSFNASARRALCLLLLLGGLGTQACFGAKKQPKAIIAYLDAIDKDSGIRPPSELPSETRTGLMVS